jgi:hydrogenase nickel insertion protein HypA
VHELSIATELLRVCEERLRARGGAALARVRVAVGELSSVDPSLLAYAWEGVVAGGPHERAALDVEWRPAVQSCAACGVVAERQPGSWLRLCPTCGAPLAIAGGDELDLLSIEAAVPTAATREVTP